MSTSRAPKNSRSAAVQPEAGHGDGVQADWRPTAGFDALRTRAHILSLVRAFFAERQVLEVETPALSSAATVDPNLASFQTRFAGLVSGSEPNPLYLHTSPEFPMKRLLAAGSGPIYQLCKVFRDGEAGQRHNPEFTLLEWYRPGWSYHALMDEVETLVGEVLGLQGFPASVPRLTYAQAFEQATGLDPHRAGAAALRQCAAQHGAGLPAGLAREDRDGWLDLLLGSVVIPALSREGGCFVYDYPASQAALARVRPGEVPVAERFELWLQGVEVANGFQELTDAAEQRARFEAERGARARQGQPLPAVDERLLAALEAGLPDCAGVALGVDRLVMLALGEESIDQVLAFPTDRA